MCPIKGGYDLSGRPFCHLFSPPFLIGNRIRLGWPLGHLLSPSGLKNSDFPSAKRRFSKMHFLAPGLLRSALGPPKGSLFGPKRGDTDSRFRLRRYWKSWKTIGFTTYSEQGAAWQMRNIHVQSRMQNVNDKTLILWKSSYFIIPCAILPLYWGHFWVDTDWRFRLRRHKFRSRMPTFLNQIVHT